MIKGRGINFVINAGDVFPVVTCKMVVNLDMF